MIRVLGSWIVVCLVTFSVAFAGDWPHLRGPNLDGRVAGAGALQDGQFGLKLAWKAPLGPGYSGVAIADGRAVTLYSEGESDWAVALDVKTGKQAWRYRIAEINKGRDGSDDGPLSTPVISDGVVYGLGPKGQLFALRVSDGEKVWSKTLQQDFGAEVPHFGFTTTPLVEGDLLVVQTGGAEGRAISGIDKKTGETRWSLGDEKVEYQSPASMELGGRRQIVAISGRQVQGLEPSTGKVLWEHPLEENDSVGSANPTYAGGDRLLLFASGAAVVLQVGATDDGFEVEELYRSKELGNTYAVPVYHDGHLYGFKGQFLTCVNAETGERVWKSRPPGGRGLILVDWHLVVFGAEGNVVVAEATPEGYREKTRLQALDGSGYTWPSFADGQIFVRNLKEMASVSVVAGSAASIASAGPGAGAGAATEFGKFVRQVETAEGKAAMLDEFMNRNEQFPLVEGAYAHFVYRGDVEEIAITGTMIETGNPEPMERIAGTDFYYRTYELEPGGRWEYQFNRNFDERITDPLNPKTAPGRFGDQKLSVVMTAGYEEPAYLVEYSGGERGTLETFTFKSESLENEREVSVYLPAGYQGSDRSYPLLIVHQGKDWLERGLMANSLDNLIGDRVAPVVVAFVQPIEEWWLEAGGTGTDEYVKMLAKEFVPYLEGKYRLSGEADSRALMGTGYFGVTAAYGAFKHSDVFGGVALQSIALGLGTDDALMEQIRGKNDGITVYLDWNRYELRRIDSDIDFHQDNVTLARALEENGHEFVGGEVLDSYGWGGWRTRTDKILETLFPAN
jgi:enterochelin esterase-like enzyme/outer membrane protein assembly factor BamB